MIQPLLTGTRSKAARVQPGQALSSEPRSQPLVHAFPLRQRASRHGIGAAAFPTSMGIDHVRVYRKTNG